MAGIKASSATVTMVDGDTAADNTFDGFLTQEQIALSTTPTGTAYSWGLSKPAGSAACVAISDEDDATPLFTPDVGGYYVVTCTVDGTTSYVLRCSVTQTATTTWVDASRFPPRLNAAVAAPATGRAMFFSRDAQAMRLKRPDGSVVGLSELASAYASIYVAGGVASQSLDTTRAKLSQFTANGGYLTSTPDHANDQITATLAGVYEVTAELSFTGEPGTTYQFVLAKGGTALGVGETAIVYVPDARNYQATMRAIATLAATDVLTVYAASDKAAGAALTVVEGRLALRQIG